MIKKCFQLGGQSCSQRTVFSPSEIQIFKYMIYSQGSATLIYNLFGIGEDRETNGHNYPHLAPSCQTSVSQYSGQLFFALNFFEALFHLSCADVPANSVRDYLLPAIQNLLKDSDALDPAHKEALEIIIKDRSGGAFDTISKVMGTHLGIASSVSSFFSEGGLLGKKESTESLPSDTVESPKATTLPPPPAEDTRFRRIMRGNFTDMLRAKAKSQEDS